MVMPFRFNFFLLLLFSISALQVEAVCGQVGGDTPIEAPQILHGGVIFDTHASPKVILPLSLIFVITNISSSCDGV